MLVDDNVSEIIDLSSYASGSDLLRIAAILLIVIGTLLFIISLIGILGAVVENKVVLGIVRTAPFFRRPISYREHLSSRFD